MYNQFAFAASLVVAEIPYSILCAVVFFLPIYYMPGFQTATDKAGYQFLMVLITELFSVTLGQAVAALTPSPFIASLLNPFIIITFALFCGVTIPRDQIPKFWRSWLYELDPFTRLIGGMVVTELHDRAVKCKAEELNWFDPPQGMDCGGYMKDFFGSGDWGIWRRRGIVVVLIVLIRFAFYSFFLPTVALIFGLAFRLSREGL